MSNAIDNTSDRLIESFRPCECCGGSPCTCWDGPPEEDNGWSDLDIEMAEEEQYMLELEIACRFPSASLAFGHVLIDLERTLSFLDLRYNIFLNPAFGEVPF